MKGVKSKNKSIITISCQNHPEENEADFICPGAGDQEVINEAISALPREGGQITLLSGRYNITAPITPNRNNLVITGVGRGATTIRPSLDIQASIFQDLTPTARTPRIGLTIRDLTLDGSEMEKSSNYVNKGIYIAYLKRALFENLHVYNVGATGIGVDFLYESIIRNNIVEKCGFPEAYTGSSGIGIGTGGESEEPLLIIGNHVTQSGLAGILLEVQQPEKGKFLHHIVANNVVRDNFQYGILMRGSKRALISTNIVIRNKKDGIRLENYKETPSEDILIGNNLVQGNGGYGINIEDQDANDIQVFNNNLKWNKSGAMLAKANQNSITRFDNVADEENHIYGNLSVEGKEIYFSHLPQSDPGTAGQLWNDDGLLKISKG